MNNPVLINYLAVLICAIAAMMIGTVWYSVLFGKLWVKEQGISEEELKKGFNPAKTYSLTFIAHIVIAYALARLLWYVDAQSIVEGLRLAFLAWLGFTATTMLINALYSKKSMKLLLIDSGYHLTVMLVMGIILAAWK